MHNFVLKIIVISFTLLINTISLSMEVLFDTEQLSEDLRRNIFVVASPSIKNQLKICSKSWHAIGAKKAPNMYRLVENESLRLHYDDWRYMMMHAALDENVGVMKNILDRTQQRNFGYDFRNKYYFGTKKIFRLSCDLYDTYDCNGLRNNNWKEKAYEKFTGFDLKSNALFMACFSGDVDSVKNIVKEWREGHRENNVNADIAHDCCYIAMYNDNPHCIQELEPLVRHMNVREICSDLLVTAMRHQKKHAFAALVKNNIYKCVKDTRVLGEIENQADIPNYAEYMALYIKYGNDHTAQEMEYHDCSGPAWLHYLCSVQ
jgi:hypothetical protein